MVKGSFWYRFSPADWMAEVRFFTAEEAGVLKNLRSIIHQAGQPIPNDPAQLARAVGATKTRFIKARDKLLAAGAIVEVDGKLWDLFVEKERSFFEGKSQSAKRSANERWGNSQHNQQKDDADAVRSECDRNANKNENKIQSQNKKETRARDNDTPFDG